MLQVTTRSSHIAGIALAGVLCLTLAWTGESRAQPFQWTSHGAIADGTQFDAVRGPQHLHIVSSRYYEVDLSGTVLVAEDHGDPHHGDLDFPPALAVEDDGTVHLVTREGGDYTAGFDIRYQRRNSGGTWDRDYYVGQQEKRNYTVTVASTGGRVFVGYGSGDDNVWGDLRFFEAGAGSATAIGDISGIWRSDSGVRMRSRSGGALFFGSGKPDPNGEAYLLYAPGGGDVVGDMVAHTSVHNAGTDRKGFTDVYVDGTGHTHFTYGALHTAHYNRFDASGIKVFGSDLQIADNLGDWHMSAGLSAVAASDDGTIVVAVVLVANGTQQASDSDLLFTVSLDGGASWSTPEDTGWNTDGGEGRLTPRMVAFGDEFFLVYKDSDSNAITLASMFVDDGTGDDDTADDDDSGDDDDDSGDDDDDDDGDDDDDSAGADDDDDDAAMAQGCQCHVTGARGAGGVVVVSLLFLGWWVFRGQG